MAPFALFALLLAPAPRPAWAQDDAPPPAEEPAPAAEPAEQAPSDAPPSEEMVNIQAASKDATAPAPIDIDHETWRVIGWDDACSVAFVHLSFPALGQAIQSEPVRTRVGTMSIAPGRENATTDVVLQADGELTWDAKKLAKSEGALKKAGWTRPGYPEVIRSSAVAAQPGLAETLFSTATLSTRLKKWPGPEWRWAGADYNPLSTCALLVFEKRAAPRRYDFVLARVYNPRARIDRARAHTENARLLFAGGDLDGAAAEAEIGARASPETAVTRYNYAALLALGGHVNQALAELRAAVKIDPKYARRAREDRDFEDLRDTADFRAVLNGE